MAPFIHGVLDRLAFTFLATLALAAYVYHLVRPLSAFSHRFLCCFPVFSAFVALPWLFDPEEYVLFTGVYFWVFTWLASFKLFSFCFGSGPLSDPWIENHFFRFWVSLNSPIRIRPHAKRSSNEQSLESKRFYLSTVLRFWEDPEGYPMLCVDCILKIVLMSLLVKLYAFKEKLPALVLETVYSFNMYLFITVLSEFFGFVSSALFSIQLDPHFRQPYLASSLEDFWARRWNLTVSSNLKHAVYVPTLKFLSSNSKSKRSKQGAWTSERDKDEGQDLQNFRVPTRVPPSIETQQADTLPPKQFPNPPAVNLVTKSISVVFTFFVSGIMHELGLFYMTHNMTGELLIFFTLHGLAVVAESAFKLLLVGSWRIPQFVSIVCTLSFTLGTAHIFFFPPFIKHGAEAKALIALTAMFS